MRLFEEEVVLDRRQQRDDASVEATNVAVQLQYARHGDKPAFGDVVANALSEVITRPLGNAIQVQAVQVLENMEGSFGPDIGVEKVAVLTSHRKRGVIRVDRLDNAENHGGLRKTIHAPYLLPRWP